MPDNSPLRSGISPNQDVERNRRPENAPDGLFTDLQTVATVLGSIDGDSMRSVRLLRCHDWQAPLQILNEQFEAGFINVI